MKIHLTSVMVDDQAKAEKFYTEIFGFVVKHDVDLGADRWLTAVSLRIPDGTETLLEPCGHPAPSRARTHWSPTASPSPSSPSTTSTPSSSA